MPFTWPCAPWKNQFHIHCKCIKLWEIAWNIMTLCTLSTVCAFCFNIPMIDLIKWHSNPEHSVFWRQLQLVRNIVSSCLLFCKIHLLPPRRWWGYKLILCIIFIYLQHHFTAKVLLLYHAHIPMIIIYLFFKILPFKDSLFGKL